MLQVSGSVRRLVLSAALCCLVAVPPGEFESARANGFGHLHGLAPGGGRLFLQTARRPDSTTLSAKAMFYDPGDLGESTRAMISGSRQIRYARPFVHSGIHFLLETQQGVPLTVTAARAAKGPFTLQIRNNIGGGFLTVWDISGRGH